MFANTLLEMGERYSDGKIMYIKFPSAGMEVLMELSMKALTGEIVFADPMAITTATISNSWDGIKHRVVQAKFPKKEDFVGAIDSLSATDAILLEEHPLSMLCGRRCDEIAKKVVHACADIIPDGSLSGNSLTIDGAVETLRGIPQITFRLMNSDLEKAKITLCGWSGQILLDNVIRREYLTPNDFLDVFSEAIDKIGVSIPNQKIRA